MQLTFRRVDLALRHAWAIATDANNDPFSGVRRGTGSMSFAGLAATTGLRVQPRG